MRMHAHTLTKHTQRLCAKSRHVRSVDAMALVWRYVVHFFCHQSILAPAPVYTYTPCICVTLCVFVCVSPVRHHLA